MSKRRSTCATQAPSLLSKGTEYLGSDEFDVKGTEHLGSEEFVVKGTEYLGSEEFVVKRYIISFFLKILEVKLCYDPLCPSVG